MGLRLTRIVLVLGAAVLIPVLVAMYASSVQPRIMAGMQARNHADVLLIKAKLDGDLQHLGRAPSRLPWKEPDVWGHDFFYVTDGKSYVLASFGRDGKPGRRDYAGLLGAGPAGEPREICGDFDADEVATDRGWVARCEPQAGSPPGSPGAPGRPSGGG